MRESFNGRAQKSFHRTQVVVGNRAKQLFDLVSVYCFGETRRPYVSRCAVAVCQKRGRICTNDAIRFCWVRCVSPSLQPRGSFQSRSFAGKEGTFAERLVWKELSIAMTSGGDFVRYALHTKHFR